MTTVLELVLRAAVALVFLASSWPKLRRPRGFILTVLEYRVLPTRLAHLAGRTIPAAELLVTLLRCAGDRPMPPVDGLSGGEPCPLPRSRGAVTREQHHIPDVGNIL